MSIISRLKRLLPSDKKAASDDTAEEQKQTEEKSTGRPDLICHVVAFSNNRVIGVDGGLPWRLPNDLKHFKKLTLNKPILMGRKTYDSIGKPLPKRRNIVLSRNPDLKLDGCEVVTSVAQAYALCKDDPELMIIGGGNLYEQTLEDAKRLFVTLVDVDLDGDAFYPKIDLKKWKMDHHQQNPKDEKHKYAYNFMQLDRVE
ncbi:MAG: dihydrofolate reductase [Gammaproteobacteria bacterium]|nr:dihydrofolate reductase [Gammaproteobacteria bacterium]NNC97121.1 dihydrofolate reductase [Gammaproteobacteria bacterium]NNM13076.1 dihydrofolate reductase [Gammaproteobacteria bacterium]